MTILFLLCRFWMSKGMDNGSDNNQETSTLKCLGILSLPFQPSRMWHGAVSVVFDLSHIGVYHNAWFKEKFIYVLKVFILSLVFSLNQRDEDRLHKLAAFVVLLHWRPFRRERLNAAVPCINISSDYNLLIYHQSQPMIVEAVTASISRNLFTSFQDQSCWSCLTKVLQNGRGREWRHRFLSSQGQNNSMVVNQGSHIYGLIDQCRRRRLWQGLGLYKLFRVEEMDLAWLHESQLLWLNSAAYIHLQKHVCNLQVVNDAAEHAVKDVQGYAHMNWGPRDLQNVITVTTDHCGRVAQPRKDNLNGI